MLKETVASKHWLHLNRGKKMFNTLKLIKIAALFFILSGFASPSLDESHKNAMANLQAQSELLISVYTEQNSKLAASARYLAEKVAASDTKITRSQMFQLWLSYGDLYRQAAQEKDFDESNSKSILVLMKAQLNMLEQKI